MQYTNFDIFSLKQIIQSRDTKPHSTERRVVETSKKVVVY